MAVTPLTASGLGVSVPWVAVVVFCTAQLAASVPLMLMPDAVMGLAVGTPLVL